MKKKVIWSNYNLDYEDWKDFFDDEYPDLDEDKRIDLMYELNNEYLDDERMNLDIPVSEEIIVLGDLCKIRRLQNLSSLATASAIV